MKNSALMLLMMVSLMLAACTAVDLCEEAEHPHRATVRFAFHNSDELPSLTTTVDTMLVLATRVLNLWKCEMNMNPLSCEGRYLFNGPATVPTWAEGGANNGEGDDPSINGGNDDEDDDDEEGGDDDGGEDDGGDDDDDGGDDEAIDGGDDDDNPGLIIGARPMHPKHLPGETTTMTKDFALREGVYKFFTLNYDTTAIDNTTVNRYAASESNDVTLSDIEIKYKTYRKGDPRIKNPLEDWTDYNPYNEFIVAKAEPVFYDTLGRQEIRKYENNLVSFIPKRLTQHIDVYFELTKVETELPFVIDSVFAEISGVAGRMNMMGGFLELSTTYKMMFDTEIVDASNKPTGKPDQPRPAASVVAEAADSINIVRYHGVIDVLSVAQGKKASDLTGPGVLQLIIFTHADDKNTMGDKIVHYKKIQAKVNIYNALKEADLIKINESYTRAWQTKREGVIDIKTTMRINGAVVGRAGDEDGGIPEWQEDPDAVVVIEV